MLHGESVLESLMSAVDRPIWLVVVALAVFDLVFFLCKNIYKFMFIINPVDFNVDLM